MFTTHIVVILLCLESNMWANEGKQPVMCINQHISTFERKYNILKKDNWIHSSETEKVHGVCLRWTVLSYNMRTR